MKKLALLTLCLIAIVVISGCTGDTTTKITEVVSIVGGSQISNVTVSKVGTEAIVKFVPASNTTAQLLLEAMSFAMTYNISQVDPTVKSVKYIIINKNNKELGTISADVSKVKAYREKFKEDIAPTLADMYLALANSLNSTWDPSVPELIPTAMWGGVFGESEEESTEEPKEVTHLEIYPSIITKNWDADAEKDGFVFHIRPLADDNSLVPVDGNLEIKLYNVLCVKESEYTSLCYKYEKNDLVCEGSVKIEASKFDRFYGSQEIRVAWDDIEPYSTSLSDEGIMYVKLTTEGKSFEAKIGDSEFDMVPLRLSD